LNGLSSDDSSPALQISRQRFAGGSEIKAHVDASTFVQDDGSMAPKPAFSSLDRVSLVLTADSWIGRSGSPVSAALAGSAGFQISGPNRASVHRYVVVCGFLDLTLSSPWKVLVVGSSMKAMALGSRASLRARWPPDKCARYAAVFNFSRANESSPNLRRRAKTPPTERSIWFP
jgi:hypothetical protein